MKNLPWTTLALWVLMTLALVTSHTIDLDDLAIPSAYVLWLLLLLWHLSFLLHSIRQRGPESKRHMRRIGLFGLAILMALPVGALTIRSLGRAASVRRGEDRVRAVLRLPHPDLPKVWGKLESIEGSGYEVVWVFWDIAGVSGNLVACRTAHFEGATVPLVIEVRRGGFEVGHGGSNVDGVRVVRISSDRLTHYARSACGLLYETAPEVVYAQVARE